MSNTGGTFDVTLSQGQMGTQSKADGNFGALRLGKDGSLVVSEAHGRYYENTSRGKMYYASIAVAGVAPGTALSTAPALTIWNPVSSNILVAIHKIIVGYVSGTLGAGSFVHAQNASQVTIPSGGTELTPSCGLLNSSRGIARAFTGSTISATSTLIAPSMITGASLASTANPPSQALDVVDGAIVVPAGVAYCYQGIMAAGSTPLVMIGCFYEEISIP